MKTILALDLSSTSTGYAVFRFNSKTARLLNFGQIRTDNNLSHGAKYHYIKLCVMKLIKDYDVDAIVIESYFTGIRSFATFICAELRGVIKEMLFKMDKISMTEYTPTGIKKSATGSGKAKKHEVCKAMLKLFKITVDKMNTAENKVVFEFGGEKYYDDATDAVAIGVTHAKETMPNPIFLYKRG